jgi:hypothetical protein
LRWGSAFETIGVELTAENRVWRAKWFTPAKGIAGDAAAGVALPS